MITTLVLTSLPCHPGCSPASRELADCELGQVKQWSRCPVGYCKDHSSADRLHIYGCWALTGVVWHLLQGAQSSGGSDALDSLPHTLKQLRLSVEQREGREPVRAGRGENHGCLDSCTHRRACAHAHTGTRARTHRFLDQAHGVFTGYFSLVTGVLNALPHGRWAAGV